MSEFTAVVHEADVITGNTDLELLHNFSNFPVCQTCIDDDAETDMFLDIDFYISQSSGCIQLKSFVPENILYATSGYTGGGHSKIWREHHHALANLIRSICPASVLEIGGSHGILSTLCEGVKKYTIYEPNPAPVEGCKATFIKEFFNADTKLNEEYDLIVCSHVLEHIYEPDIFLRNISKSIHENAHLLISVPNILAQLEQKYLNCLAFEHPWLVTVEYIEFLLNKNGFVVEHKELFKDGHSIFILARKIKNIIRKHNHKDIFYGLYNKHKIFFTEFISHYYKLVQQINKSIKESIHPVYIFGAKGFTQYLFSFGLDISRINNVLDNANEKHGKRLYGTNLICSSPIILKDMRDATIILHAASYTNEIKEDILKNINPRVQFI